MAQKPGEWRPLFNGKDLTGWTVAAGRGGTAPGAPAPQPAQWKVEDGVLVGGQGTGRGSLVTTEQFKDFDLELEFMLAELGTKCSAELIGEKQENASEDKSCLYNSGITFRTGYQVNLGRREAGEFIGIVVHRKAPGAIRGNVLWLSTGDEKFPTLRKKEGWNRLQHQPRRGPHITVSLNGTEDLRCDRRSDRPGGSTLEGSRTHQPAVAASRRVRRRGRIREVPEHPHPDSCD